MHQTLINLVIFLLHVTNIRNQSNGCTPYACICLLRSGKDRIELWTKTAANEALQMGVGKQIKQLLDIPDSSKIGFVVFVSTWPANISKQGCCSN